MPNDTLTLVINTSDIPYFYCRSCFFAHIDHGAINCKGFGDDMKRVSDDRGDMYDDKGAILPPDWCPLRIENKEIENV